jgi:hypothetical protein
MPADSEEAREMALECIGRAGSLTRVLAAYAWGGDARSWSDVYPGLEVLSEYLAWHCANTKPRSAQRHAYAYQALHPTFGHLRLSDITPQRIEQYKQQRRGAGRSPVTTNRERALLRHLFTMAMTWGNMT